jgi:hypothetical protein
MNTRAYNVYFDACCTEWHLEDAAIGVRLMTVGALARAFTEGCQQRGEKEPTRHSQATVPRARPIHVYQTCDFA